ncbi:MAG: DUF5320 domain-containing protein [Bacteroidales bacterium]|nr:DUF5320 domain-containing protein [Bacteroidales bacterium]
MPGGDRTGPEGLGRMTGRKMGLCTGNETPGFNNPNAGIGQGLGRGGGRGRGFNRGGARGQGMGLGFRTRGRWNDDERNRDTSPGISYREEIQLLKDQVRELEKKLSGKTP